MLFLGTQMYIITFIFVCIEAVILFYLLIYKLARPDDKNAVLNIWLVLLLLIYNITGGLLPDPNLPGSLFLQEVIAYATGFITPSYFPYYVYRAFDLKKMRFHIYHGVSLFLLLPFILFSIIYGKTHDLEKANDILLIPVIYAIWVIISLVKALKFKYDGNLNTYQAKEEFTGLLLSLTPWIGLPIIIFLNLGQGVEVSVTNTGFLLLLGLHLKNHIAQSRKEHERLIESEVRLLNWNSTLQQEVEKRTNELKISTDQKANTLINLAHETKTPITLIKNYLDEYSIKRRGSDDLIIVRKSIDKLTIDINNLLDIEKFEKGLSVYRHDQIAPFSEILGDNLMLFRNYAAKKRIKIESNIEPNIFIKADPLSINRVVNNLLENSIKYSLEGQHIQVLLKRVNQTIEFSVTDNGIGIPPSLHEKILEPYFQIYHAKKNSQGLGLGLPIVKKVVDSLDGEILIQSDPAKTTGTKIAVVFKMHDLQPGEFIANPNVQEFTLPEIDFSYSFENDHDKTKQTILVVEDNFLMVHFLFLKLKEKFNVYPAFNGNDAIEKLVRRQFVPDLIISDILMDNMDGYTFAEKIAQDTEFNHIPFLFLSAISGKDERLNGLDLGAIDFIAKPFSLPELLKKINSILVNVNNQKRIFLQNAVKALNTLDIDQRNGSSAYNEDKFERNCQIYDLTSREKSIAKLIRDGETYKEIGDSLSISKRTVTTHVQNMFEKVRVSNKIELINKLIA